MLQVSAQDINLGLHFLANGLVWISVDSGKEGSQQQRLLQHLSVLPKAHAVSFSCPCTCSHLPCAPGQHTEVLDTCQEYESSSMLLQFTSMLLARHCESI